MLLLLVVILICLFIASYVMFDKDLLAPPTIVCLGLLFGSLCTFYNEKRWGLEFSSRTLILIVVAVVSFIIGGFIAFIIYNYNRLNRARFDHDIFQCDPIRINRFKMFLIIAFELFTLIALFLSLRRITGSSTLSNITSIYRSAKLNYSEIADARLPTIVKQSVSVCMYLALFYSYIVGNNIAAKQKQQILYWLPIILSTIMSFMQGYRSDMLRYWIALIVVMYTITKRSVGWKNSRESRKIVRRMAFSVIGIALIFVAARETVGRSTSKDPLYYLTFYAGCPIAALDSFVKNPIPPSNIWGKETFYTLVQNVRIIFKRSDLRYSFFHEFTKSPNGTYIGNVYTAFRPPYYDFGFWGMIVYLIIMGTFFTLFYLYIRKRHSKGPVDIPLMIYSYVAYTFFMYFYNCYNHFVSISILKAIAIFTACNWFLFKLKIGHHYTLGGFSSPDT